MSSPLPSRASTDQQQQLPPKPTPSLPARPAVSPLAVRSPSKSDPPLPSFHAPTPPAPPAQQDAPLRSHQLESTAKESTRIPMGERRRTAEDPASPTLGGAAVLSSHGLTRALGGGAALGVAEQLSDSTGKQDGVGGSSRMGVLGTASHGSGELHASQIRSTALQESVRRRADAFTSCSRRLELACSFSSTWKCFSSVSHHRQSICRPVVPALASTEPAWRRSRASLDSPQVRGFVPSKYA